MGTGWKHEELETYLANRPITKTRFVVQWPKGPLYTLVGVLDAIEPEDFLLCPADYIVPPALVRLLIEARLNSDANVIMAVDSRAGRGTRVFVDDAGAVLSIGKPPSTEYYSYSSAMMILADGDFSRRCRDGITAGFASVREVLSYGLHSGLRIHAVDVSSYDWYDVDTLPALLGVAEHILASPELMPDGVYVLEGDTLESGNRIDLSTGVQLGQAVKIVGPVFIDRGCVIENNSEIGPYVSLGTDTHVLPDTNLEHCITHGMLIPKGHYRNCIFYDGQEIDVER